MEEPELVKATQEELDEILAGCRCALTAKDFRLLQGVFRTFVFLMLKPHNARTSIGRLKKLLFGPHTERLRDIVEDARIVDQPAQPADEGTPAPPVDVAASTTEAAGAGAASWWPSARAMAASGPKRTAARRRWSACAPSCRAASAARCVGWAGSTTGCPGHWCA
jgi:hypothetical protein